MASKPVKIFIFLIYTLFIFQSYVFALVPAAVCADFNILRYRFLATVFCPLLFIPWILAHFFFIALPQMLIQAFQKDIFSSLAILAVYYLAPIVISCLLFYWWLKRQSPLTAWGIAFVGSCYAFMIFPSSMAMGDGGHKDAFGWVALPAVNCFYFILCIADILQKKFWPDNKFANRIRRGLASLCLNPSNCVEVLSDENTNA